MALAADANGTVPKHLKGKLTAQLILASPQYMNPCKDYELDLRGNKIATIENLGATQNQFDSIDLSDNAVVRLEGFPKLPRLKQLLLNNNRITRIGNELEESIPNLQWLILAGNKLTHLVDLNPLSSLPKLQYLSLMDNPVTKKPNYRLHVISRCPRLKALDFRKIKQKERDLAKAYGESQAGREAGKQTHFDPDEELAKIEAKQAQKIPAVRKGPTPEQITAIKAAIANASTLEEVQRLEQALRSGHLPSQIQVGGSGPAAMDEG